MSDKETQPSAHDQVLASMLQLAAQMQQHKVILTMPPPSMQAFGTHYVELTPRRSLTAEIPLRPSLETRPV